MRRHRRGCAAGAGAGGDSPLRGCERRGRRGGGGASQGRASLRPNARAIITTMRTAKVIADRVIRTRDILAAMGIARQLKQIPLRRALPLRRAPLFCVKRIHLRRAYRSQTAHKVEGPKRRGRGHGKNMEAAGRALLLCALLAGAGSLAAAPPGGESGSLTPQERARRANVPEGPWIWIDIPQKSLTLYEGTEVKKPLRCGHRHGRYAFAHWHLSRYQPFCGRSGRLRHAVFGAERPVGTIWHPWHQQAPAASGSNASHGCIRMYVL